MIQAEQVPTYEWILEFFITAPYRIVQLLPFPINIILLEVGLVGFVLFVVIPFFRRTRKRLRRAATRQQTNKRPKKSNNTALLISLAALAISILSLGVDFLQYLQASRVDVKLACEVANNDGKFMLGEESGDYQYLYGYAFFETECNLKNLGSVDVVIDKFSHVFFDSSTVTLNRDNKEVSLFEAAPSIEEPVETPFTLKSRTQERYVINTYFPLLNTGICSFSEDVSLREYGERCKKAFDQDLEMKQQIIENCDKGFSMCFYDAVGKYPMNYLYEGIKIPVHGGYQRLNGIGQSVELFDGMVVLDEVSIANVFPFTENENIKVLSRERYQFISSIDDPWYDKTYWVKDTDSSSTGFDFMNSVILLWPSLILSTIGNIVLVQKTYPLLVKLYYRYRNQ